MAYFFNDPVEGRIEIPIERWVWCAVHQDDRAIFQFDQRDDSFHRIGEVDQENLKAISLTCLELSGSSITIPWKKGMKLVHKYRNIVLDAYGERKDYRIYIFGWKSAEGDCFHFVLPDNRIITTDDENFSVVPHL